MIREAWVVVVKTRDQRRSTEAGLVLTALQIEYEVARVDGSWMVSVPAEFAPQAGVELAEYAQENRTPPVGTRPMVQLSNGWSGVLIYVGVLVLVAVMARRYEFGYDWLRLGRIDSIRVLEGEWWRTLTALTLHIDLSHLVGNIVFGAFFGLYVGRYFGPGIGWAGIVAGGALGNALNVLMQPARHLSIGASTSVFAALGLLVAYTWQQGFWKNTPWRTRIAPVTAGIGLLAFTGTGSGVDGDNVDILAHLTGFVAGFGVGILMARMQLSEGSQVQRLWGAIAFGSLVLAWLTAFSS